MISLSKIIDNIKRHGLTEILILCGVLVVINVTLSYENGSNLCDEIINIGHDSYERAFTREEMAQKMVMNTSSKLNASNINSVSFDKDGNPKWEQTDARGWLLQETVKIEAMIDRLIQTYGIYISPDLLTALEKVRSTQLMSCAMRSMISAPVDVNFDESNNGFFFDFYSVGQNLEKVSDNNLRNI